MIFRKKPKENRILKETAKELGICYTDIYREYEKAEKAGYLYMDALREAVKYAYDLNDQEEA